MEESQNAFTLMCINLASTKFSDFNVFGFSAKFSIR